MRELTPETITDAVLDQMRRLADLLIAGAILILALPLMVLVVLAIRWGGRGAIFERQTCFARGCRRFQMLPHHRA